MVRKLPTLPMTEIEELCRKYGVEKLAVFGSILRDDFTPNSDVDFLVRFANDDTGPWMNKLTNMEEELSEALGRKVDLVNWSGIERSRNRVRRKDILDSATIVYER